MFDSEFASRRTATLHHNPPVARTDLRVEERHQLDVGDGAEVVAAPLPPLAVEPLREEQHSVQKQKLLQLLDLRR